MSTVEAIRDEWRQLKDDAPGHRFLNHRERMRQHGRALAVARALLGLALVAVGFVMLVVPGPGLLGIVFGLALLAGMSSRLARLMDRAEPPVRRVAGRVRDVWNRQRPGIKALVVSGGALLAATGAVLVTMWVWF